MKTYSLTHQVPQIWHNVNVYPSLKSLGSWIRDLELRIDFISVSTFDQLVHVSKVIKWHYYIETMSNRRGCTMKCQYHFGYQGCHFLRDS